jgi:hypothetical protein
VESRQVGLVVILLAVATTLALLLLASPNLLVMHDQGAVGFGASLNATTVAQGQAERVYLEDWNKLDFKNSVPLTDGLGTLNLSSNLCGGDYPGGIAVYEGTYDRTNASSAASLPFYTPGAYGCGVIIYTNSFTFGPLQNLSAYFDLAGYYTSGSTPVVGGGATDGVLHPFLPGVYTVIAGDPLGSTKVLYFRVTATTAHLERTGPLSSLPASWLDPCGEGAAGNVTTGVGLGLNSSSALDHLNIDQIYSQIVNSSAFAYKSVGHGWVVSEWGEIGPSENNASAGQVVVSFILTSGGVPSSHVNAYYDPISGTAAVTSDPIPVANCPA